MDQHGWPVTFSIGVLSCPTLPATTEELLREADRIMYSIKKTGKGAIRYGTYTA
jgi:GGDEF domain-containing protein